MKITNKMRNKGFALLPIIGLVGLALLFGYLGGRVNKSPTFGGNYNVSGGGTYRLRSTAAPTDSTIHLSSFKEPVSNIPYTMSYINTDISYGTLDPQTNHSEFISFTGITQNTDGTADLTSVTRGIARTPGTNGCNTASTTLEQAHAGQSIFILSDAPCALTQYTSKTNSELIPSLWTASGTPSTAWRYDADFTISSSSRVFAPANWIVNNFLDTNKTGSKTLVGNYTFSGTNIFSNAVTVPLTPVAATDAASKGYIDTGVLAGCANSTTTVKGCVELATSAEITAGTATGGTGAALVVTPDAFQTAYGTTLPYITSTTTLQQLATTTFSVANGMLVSGKNNIRITFVTPFVSGGSATTTAGMQMVFNSDFGANYISALATNLGTPSSNVGVNFVTFSDQVSNGASPQHVVEMNIRNSTGVAKGGTITNQGYATTTSMGRIARTDTDFLWNNGSAITQIDLGWTAANVFFGTTTQFKIEQW